MLGELVCVDPTGLCSSSADLFVPPAGSGRRISFIPPPRPTKIEGGSISEAPLPGSGTYKSFHMRFFENRSDDLRPATGRGDWPGLAEGTGLGWPRGLAWAGRGDWPGRLGGSQPTPRRPQDSTNPRAGRWSKKYIPNAIYHNTIYNNTIYNLYYVQHNIFYHTPIRYIQAREHAFHYSNVLTIRRRLLRRVGE